jgi:hypothetical protein
MDVEDGLPYPVMIEMMRASLEALDERVRAFAQIAATDTSSDDRARLRRAAVLLDAALNELA